MVIGILFSVRVIARRDCAIAGLKSQILHALTSTVTPPACRIQSAVTLYWTNHRESRRTDHGVGKARVGTGERYRYDQWLGGGHAALIDHHAVLVIFNGASFDGDAENIFGLTSCLRPTY